MVPNHSSPPGLYITGLGSQYPPYLLGPEKLEEFAARFYDVESPGYAISFFFTVFTAETSNSMIVD